MNDLTTKLAEALRECMDDADGYEKRSGKKLVGGWPTKAREALRLYEQDKAQPVQDLPPLPEPDAVRAIWSDDGTKVPWDQWHDENDPLPTEWDDEPPDQTIDYYTHTSVLNYARAALAATPAAVPERLLFSARNRIAQRAGVKVTEQTNAVIRETLAELRAATPAPDLCPSSGLWCAATPAPAPQAKSLTTEQTAKLFAEVNSLMPGLDTPEEMFATIVRFVEREHGIGQGAATPAPAPLTDECLDALAQKWAGVADVPPSRLALCREFARVIERAHGIGQGKEASK